MFLEKRPDLAHARAVANERRSHEIDALLDAEEQIGAILVGHRGKRHRDARHVDGLALAEHAAVAHAADDVVALDALDHEPDEAVVDEDGHTGLHAGEQLSGGLRDAVRIAFDLIGRQGDGGALLERYRSTVRKAARADLGPLRVEHDGAGGVHLLAHALHTRDALGMLGMRAVAEVQASNVHARLDKRLDRLVAVDSRTERANDLGALMRLHE